FGSPMMLVGNPRWRATEVQYTTRKSAPPAAAALATRPVPTPAPMTGVPCARVFSSRCSIVVRGWVVMSSSLLIARRGGRAVHEFRPGRHDLVGDSVVIDGCIHEADAVLGQLRAQAGEEGVVGGAIRERRPRSTHERVALRRHDDRRGGVPQAFA